jgi:hypothetical protein
VNHGRSAIALALVSLPTLVQLLGLDRALGGHPAAHAVDLPQLGSPVRVDGVAAYVGGASPGEGVRVILLSDVELRARISLFNAGSGPRALSDVLTPALLQATLAALLGESLIAVEALRLGLAAPTASAVRDQRARLGTAGRGERAFQELMEALEVGAEEIDDIARQRAVVGAFLAANLEGTLDVSETELVRAFETEDHPFQGLPFEAERAHFAAWLQQKLLQEAVGRWVVSLRERIPHRVLVSFTELGPARIGS